MDVPTPLMHLLISSTGNHSRVTNCSDILKTRNQSLNTFLVAFLSVILLHGVIFNSFAIWVFCFKMKKWTETRVFMMNLLMSDCCLLLFIPFRIYAAQHKWNLGPVCCKVVLPAYFMNTYMSIAIITLISVDRYIAIKFPLKARSLRSPKKAATACGIVLMLLLGSYFYLDFQSDFIFREPSFCFEKVFPDPLGRSLYFSILGFWVPLIIQSFCTVEIIRTLNRKDLINNHESKSVQKTIYIVSCNLTIFLVCFLPVNIGHVVRFTLESLKFKCSVIKNINHYVYGAQAIGDLNCCLDAVCYYFVAKEFWEKSMMIPKFKKLQHTWNRTQDSSL
ncbi:G-protein coupled receptor 35-like [Spea bombifrons]|uniref:G-protein coupled receptor 35-like n=1 Tax=Spea bombifrons TaxID=233779 RepID=UPI00234BC3DB|nr:G-protein coupled receptor 35-like [Spea bombifrons]